jgi:hypothetical protein
MRASAEQIPFGRNLTDTLTAASPALMFGLRLWASVCLALFVAFWLELDNPFWAGTSAAIVCQPQLGASLRKGWFRMIGTVVGATFVVVLTSWFPQSRFAFLGLLALWAGLCAFAATTFRDFASYSAALAGYTAVIIAADNLGATGGASPDIFMLAVTRASEICIGIASAGVILAATDFGGAQRRLAASIANLAAEIMGRFCETLAREALQLTDTQTERREFVRRVIALDPMIDQTLGESSHARYHSPTLRSAVDGLFMALGGWRGVETHLSRLPEDMARRQTEIILRSIPPSCDRHESQVRRHAGWLIRWPRGASATRPRRRCSPCRPATRRCGCSPTRRPKCCPACCVCSTGSCCSSILLTQLLLAIAASRRPCPTGCPRSSTRDARSLPSVSSS